MGFNDSTDFPDWSPILLSIIRFLLFTFFLFYTFSHRFRAVDHSSIKLTPVSFWAHVKIAPRIVTFTGVCCVCNLARSSLHVVCMLCTMFSVPALRPRLRSDDDDNNNMHAVAQSTPPSSEATDFHQFIVQQELTASHWQVCIHRLTVT